MKKIFLLMITIVFIFLGINSVSAGFRHECGITIDNELKCWGNNSNGQLNIPDGYLWKKINTGGFHTCGITIDNELKCWGANNNGQLNIPDGYLWKNISAGGNNTCGITIDNELKCWGNNNYFQIDIPNGYLWSNISTGETHTCGITIGNELKCFGNNNDGQIDIPNGYLWSNISTGGYHTCGITINDELKCWGANNNGQLNFPFGYSWLKISNGLYYTCGITIENELKCWGNNSNGVIDFPIGYNWEDIISSSYHSCGLTLENELKCWGNNQSGQLNFPTGYKWYSFTKNIEIQQPIQIPTPTNLKQYIHSPHIEKREEIQVGSKIGKFQSGSGVILEAAIQNDTTNSYNMIFEVYKHGQNIPLYNSSIEITSGTGYVTLPYLGAGDYTWKAKIIDNDGNESEIVDYMTNQAWEIDFSIFEGFEPYPYGYSFVNASPDISKLDGKITGYKIFNSRKKEGGTKWEIMDMVFPIESFNGDEREYFAAFESLGLNNDKPTIFSDGICFGLGLSALTQYHKPEILRRNFSIFSNNIGTGYIFDKINIQNDINNNYQLIGLDDNLKSILALQLYQKETSFDNKMNYSYDNDTPIDILNKVKTNPGKYILNFKGKTGCTLGFGCNEVGHAVIPYKVEGNKIYIWDNNVPFPFFEKTIGLKFYGNKQYIEIDTINNKFNVPFYNRDKFEKIGIVFIDESFADNTSVIGFNNTDTLYTLNGNSDILLTDINGNKTGYKNGEIYEEITGARIVVNYAGDTTENTWKQIYLPQKLENLTIEINGKIDENYDLMIAGGDYYTKLEGITTSSGQTDTFNISRENIKIDLDDTKTNSGTYNILVDDFQNNGTGSVYIDSMKINTNLQQYNINWTEVINNTNNAVNYQIDTNNDGNYDTNTNFSPIYQDNVAPTTTYNLIGTKTPNSTNNSYIETLNIELNSTDNENGTGVDKIYYSLDNLETTEKIYLQYNNQIEVNGVGNYTLSYYSVDKFGNKEEIKTINFTLTEKPETYAGNISGYIYDDSNKNSILDTGEKTMAGWKVCIDTNNNNDCEENIEPFNVTNNNGYYEFNGLSTGTYNIKLIPHQNWELTNPTSGRYTITLSNGQVITNKNFGAYKTKGNK